MMKNPLAVILLLGIFIAQAGASDVENGERLAKMWCASCHLVNNSQVRAENEAPNFSTIGRTKKISESDLAQSLLAPHPRMPDRGLSWDEARDIAAYIRSFRSR